ncbi:YajG family lipoprotein [Aliidiomarina shirensis]|nr:YajG family lipoprotein [Aliidiomarina shirensis]
MRNIIAVVMLAGIILLSGCANTPNVPNEVRVTAPDITDFQKPVLQPVRLSVRDQRTQNHVLRVEHTPDNAEFATTHIPMATLMSAALREYWPHDDNSQVLFTVYLEDALTRVVAQNDGYEAEHHVAVRVVVRSGTEWIGRQYVTRVSGGPYRKVNFEQINDTFNRAVHATLRDLMSDQILQEWLQDHVQ